jgi:hypothetical protein
MPNAAVKKFIEELKVADMPFFEDGNRIVCGGAAALIVEPDLQSETPTMYRFEIPTAWKKEQEFSYAMLFLHVFFGLIFLIPIRSQLKALLEEGVPFSAHNQDLDLRGFVEGEEVVFLVKSHHHQQAP